MPNLPHFGHNKNFPQGKFQVEIENSQFKPLLHPSHQVQFHKNQVERFGEKSKNPILKPKMPHLPHFGHKNFPENLERVDLNQFLML